MKKIRIIRALAAASVLALTLAGCVEREEEIKVHEDGSMDQSVSFTADSEEELYAGRVPSEADGWRIFKSISTLEDGKIKHLWEANKSFPMDASLPGTYASLKAPDENLYLTFPTTLKRERRKGDTSYHFRRVYQGRPWAYLDSLEAKVSGDRIEKLREKGPENLNHQERMEFVRLMARVETLKMLAFARTAFLEVTPQGAQDGWLKVYGNTFPCLDGLDYNRIATLMAQKNQGAEDTLVSEAENFESSIKNRILSGLHSFCGYTKDQVKRFEKRYARHERFFRVTDDLGCESFRITVYMPGEILGTNADEVEGNRATWSFNGKLLYDCDLELLVSSRVKH
jgi:hypothetical protein